MKGKKFTKAGRLNELKSTHLAKYILPQLIVIRSDLKKLESLLANIELTLGSTLFAVRSSSSTEDQEISNAGKYKSILGVKKSQLSFAIDEVLGSYESESPFDEVLIQPFLNEVTLSGVVFTKDPTTGSPYFIFNWVEGNDTTVVTSGAENGNTLVVANSTRVLEGYLTAWQSELIKIARDLQEQFSAENLDIEFAISLSRIILLQVRPLNVKENHLTLDKHAYALREISKKIDELQNAHPYLVGRSTIFGIMPDWNPAELIGIRPNELAFSLFKELISDGIWAYERSNFGYRNVRSFPLVVEFAGHPYVDFRVSVNSMIPADLEDEIANKLADYYLEKLTASPHLHDKVEFEIILSNFTFDLDFKLSQIPSLSERDRESVKSSLLKLTRGIIQPNTYGLNNVLAKATTLDDRFQKITASNQPILTEIYWLIEDCKRYGTLPFAGVARSAFVAVSLLNSLVQSKRLQESFVSNFYSSLKSPASSIILESQVLSRDEFLNKYGHLRPGTFDALSRTYFEAYEDYFGNRTALPFSSENSLSNFKNELIKALELTDCEQIMGIDARSLVDFCENAIEGREELKFRFTRNISRVLDLIVEFGEDHDISREEIIHFSIQDFIRLYRETGSIEEFSSKTISHGKEKKMLSYSLWLPALITKPEDVFIFEFSKQFPNYITQKDVTGPIVRLSNPKDLLEGKIVLIESADPGYDWIFARNISGLITCFGGVNSHMAVRSKELDIPAVIGVGDRLYDRLTQASVVFIDSANKRLGVIS